MTQRASAGGTWATTQTRACARYAATAAFSTIARAAAGLRAPVRRLEALAPLASPAPAAAAFARAPVATGAVEASFLSCAFVRFSVPTSVSLSSPRMNASTRLWAMSSWIWIGGLFMK